jgi:hypothetical protein
VKVASEPEALLKVSGEPDLPLPADRTGSRAVIAMAFQCSGRSRVDRWRSHRFYRALQRLKSPLRYICEIFGAPQYSSFSTQSAKSGHSRAVAVEPVIPGRPAKRGRTRNPSLGGAPPSKAASPKTAPPFARDGRVRPPEATAERTPKLHRLGPADSRTTIVESDCPTGVWSLDASPRTTQPCFTIGHALSLRGRAASSAGTVASSLR